MTEEQKEKKQKNMKLPGGQTNWSYPTADGDL